MGHVTVDDLASSIESLSDRERAKLMKRVGRLSFCGPLEEYHNVVYETRDEAESRHDLQILEVVFNLKCRQLLFRSLERLLAFERVEGLDEYRRRFKKVLKKNITLADVERLVLAELVTDLSDGLVDFLSSTLSIQGCDKFAVKLTEKNNNFEPAARDGFLALLDEIAATNRKLLRSDTSRVSRAITFAGVMLSFRLRALVIQLLAQSLIAAFRRPSAQLINEVEDALSSLAKSLAVTRAGGRTTLRDSVDSDEFRSLLRKTYVLETKRRQRLPTQEHLARAMNLSVSALRQRRRDFGIPWPPA